MATTINNALALLDQLLGSGVQDLNGNVEAIVAEAPPNLRTYLRALIFTEIRMMRGDLADSLVIPVVCAICSHMTDKLGTLSEEDIKACQEWLTNRKLTSTTSE